jgi:4-diphosphocytidyl-2-C-methyl-D-erythritol kinase
MVLNSYAKINLGLKILGKKGKYHLVETILQSIDLGDRITFSPWREGIAISSSYSGLPQGERNLCYRAWRLLSPGKGVRIVIEKRIPVGGGLGGGSSNAAMTLWALNRIWNLGKSQEELMRVAARLGSDVPFFLVGGTVLCEGRGEVLKPLPPLQGVSFLLVNPGFEVFTSWAYSNWSFSLTEMGKFIRVKSCLSQGDLNQIPSEFPNDLEEVVAKRYPVIKHIKEELYGSGALAASLSGSGPTVWGLFKDREEAIEVAESLKKRDGWWIKLARPTDSVLPEEG